MKKLNSVITNDNTMKKIIFILLVFVAADCYAQSPPFQKPVTFGYQLQHSLTTNLMGIPSDTFTVRTDLKPFKWFATKDGSLYLWSFANDMWEAISGGSGGVNSVLGTANRITSSGGANPVINIAATYVGQNSITTLGTITTGVWNGTAIANANLANSTISGISLGSNLADLTRGYGLLYNSGTTYNGGTARTILLDSATVFPQIRSTVVTKGNEVYTVAANNSPAELKARADYICDGTADESEINTALALGNVVLVEGTYNIASSITVPDNTSLKGSGDGTILVVTTGIGAITDNGTTGIFISDLKITGNGTASQRGIYMTSVGSGTGTTAVTGCVIENVYITGTDLAGIELEQCANSIINNIRTTDIDFDGIVIDRSSRVTVSNTTHNGNFAGIYVTGATSTHVTIENNIIEGSLDIGIQVENATDCIISGNIVRSSESFCLDIQNCNRMVVNGNTLDRSVSQVVFNTSSVPNSVFSNNLITNGQLEGFIISSCENSTVSGNTIYNNGLQTNNTYDAVSLFSDDIIFTGNRIKRGTGNQHRYGLRITAPYNRNVIEGNNFYQAGATGDISDLSSTTRKRDNTANAGGNWIDLLYTDYQLEMNTGKLLGRSTASQGKAEEIAVGTGVFTALGVNTGSAGSFVVNGGALGTPSSGTLTNATGLPPTTGIVGWPANASGTLTNDGSGNLSWGAGGGTTWNGISSPTGDQALTFDAGESSTWTNSNTTEDLFTINSSTTTTSSFLSLNRTSTALAAGNNIMELVSSGTNGTSSITATGLSVAVTNTGTTSVNKGIDVDVNGGTTDNYSIFLRNVGNNQKGILVSQGTTETSAMLIGQNNSTTNWRIFALNSTVLELGTGGGNVIFNPGFSTVQTISTAAVTTASNIRMTMGGRLLQKQGADVASVAGAIALGADGNTFEITGTNAITLISNTNWQNGSVVTFVFTSTASLTDGTANSGTDIGMELAGNANFTGSAGATLTLVLSEIGGTQRWRELARSVQ